MSNHIHRILIIDVNNKNGGGVDADGGVVDNGGDVADNIGGNRESNNDRDVDDNCRDVACNVPTIITDQKENDLGIPKKERMSQILPKLNSVSTVIRSYKSAVTKYSNRWDLAFAWQSRFHDYIIRNDESYQRILNYIRNNPSNWKEDDLF